VRPVRERLGHRRLRDLTEEDIDDLVGWMLTAGRRRGGPTGSGLGVRSVQLALGRLRAALTLAVVRKLVAQYTKIPREARTKAAAAQTARAPWAVNEIKTFLTACRDHPSTPPKPPTSTSSSSNATTPSPPCSPPTQPTQHRRVH